MVVTAVRQNFRDLNITANDIARAHRMPGEQRVICRFVRSGKGSVRDQIYFRRLELKGTNMYVNESVTKFRQDLISKLIPLKKANRLFSVFTRYGRVYCTEQRGGRMIRIDSVQEIENLAAGQV